MTYILQQVVKTLLGCDLLYSNRVGDRPAYPFVTYTFVVPEQDTTGDWLGKGRQYVTHLQVDCHSNHAMQAMQMADRLYAGLHENFIRRFFEQADVEPQEITQTSDRTILEGINYDYRFGFDCSFLVSDAGHIYKPEDLNFAISPDTEIKSVHVDDPSDKDAVNVSKKGD